MRRFLMTVLGFAMLTLIVLTLAVCVAGLGLVFTQIVNS